MTHTKPARHRRAVQLWLFAVATLMVVTLVVGGATRLTESGLSIVEWKPMTGVLPPMSQEAVAGGVRQVQGDPAVPRTQSRDGIGGVQDDLLVGMVAQPAGAPGRCGVPCAVSHFPVARLDRAAAEVAAVAAVRLRRAARRGRLVDGVVWSRRSRERVAISARLSPDARLRDLCRHPVDRAAAVRARDRREERSVCA